MKNMRSLGGKIVENPKFVKLLSIGFACVDCFNLFFKSNLYHILNLEFNYLNDSRLVLG